MTRRDMETMLEEAELVMVWACISQDKRSYLPVDKEAYLSALEENHVKRGDELVVRIINGTAYIN